MPSVLIVGAGGTLRGAPYRFEGSADEFELEHRGFLKALAAGDQRLLYGRSPEVDL